MTGFNQIERSRRTAIYIRISTSQQTDRQETELKEFALRNGLNFNEKTDMFIDIISGFKEGEARPQYSILKNKVEAGLYQQILLSEFSRLDRKPSNLLKSIEYYQSKNVWLWFGKQQMWVRDKSDISTQIMISVLAVMSQYEIELFTARGMDGKSSYDIVTILNAEGTNVCVEIFDNRLSISNPGAPLVEVNRMIDTLPFSRNNKLAEVMFYLHL